jgi:hypothetical protein
MAFTDEEIEKVGSLTSFLGVIQNFGNDITDRLRQSLQSKVKGFTSKQLEQSIRFDVTPVGNAKYRFVVYFDEYGSYLDQGVQGVGSAGLKTNRKNKKSWRNQVTGTPFSFKAHKKPSAKHYRTWASVHGISMYAVRESVFRKGLKPNHWFSDVVNEDIANDLVKSMEEVGVKRIEMDIKNILEGKVNGK